MPRKRQPLTRHGACCTTCFANWPRVPTDPPRCGRKPGPAQRAGRSVLSRGMPRKRQTLTHHGGLLHYVLRNWPRVPTDPPRCGRQPGPAQRAGRSGLSRGMPRKRQTLTHHGGCCTTCFDNWPRRRRPDPTTGGSPARSAQRACDGCAERCIASGLPHPARRPALCRARIRSFSVASTSRGTASIPRPIRAMPSPRCSPARPKAARRRHRSPSR
jgi:hypothetical protein